MSRSLTNFLLFEDLFDNIDPTNKPLYNLSTQVFSPTVKVVQENCNTKLGKRIAVSPSVNGLVKITFNGDLDGNRMIPSSDRISREDIEDWLASSIYITYVRDLHHCTAVGGVCAGCYAATFNSAAPVVGSYVQVKNRYVLHTDHHLTSDVISTYSTTTDAATYDFKTVYLDNFVLSNSEFTSNPSNIELSSLPDTGQYLTINSVIESNKPFMNYLSSTFSGDLLGIDSVPTQDITLPLGLIDRSISEGQISQVFNQLESLPVAERSYIDYCREVKNKVEKALFLIVLTSIYNDVQA